MSWISVLAKKSKNTPKNAKTQQPKHNKYQNVN